MSKSVRTRSALALLMLLLMVLTAACGGAKNAPTPAPAAAGETAKKPAEKITFRILTPIYRGDAGNQLLKDFLEEFKKANPDLNIEFDVEFLPNYDNLNQKLTTYASGNMLPDLFMIGAGWIEAFAGKNLILPLDDKVTKEMMADYEPTIMDAGYYKGKLYGIPLVIDTRIVVYRKDMYQAAGLDPNKGPTTLAELLDHAKKLTKRDASGKILVAGFDPVKHKDRQIFYQIYWAHGAELFNKENTKALMNTPEAIAAFQYWTDLYRTHKVNDVGFASGVPSKNGGTTNAALMIFDKAAIGIYHNNIWTDVLANNPGLKDKIGFSILKDKGGPHQFYGGSMGVIAGNTKHPDVAWRVLKFLAAKEQVIRNTKAENSLPALKSLANDPYITSSPMFAKDMENMKYAKREGGPECWLEIRTLIDNAIDEMIAGKRSVKEIADELTKKADDLIAASRK